MKVAAFDLGTNSFLCLTAEKGQAGELLEVDDRAQVVRLGQDMYRGGEPVITREALERARKCLSSYLQTAQANGATKFKAVATSAARDAKNSEDLQDICDELEIELEIISGDREAELSFEGSFPSAEHSDSALIVDVGGGSTEFLYRKSSRTLSKSLNMGAVRLTEKFVSGFPTKDDDITKLRSHARSLLHELNFDFKPKSIWAIAGTPTCAVSILEAMSEFDKTKIDQYRLTKDSLSNLLFKLQSMGLEQRLKLPGMQKGREDILPAGISILLEVLDYFNESKYIVSSRGVRYGLAKEMLSV